MYLALMRENHRRESGNFLRKSMLLRLKLNCPYDGLHGAANEQAFWCAAKGTRCFLRVNADSGADVTAHQDLPHHGLR